MYKILKKVNFKYNLIMKFNKMFIKHLSRIAKGNLKSNLKIILKGKNLQKAYQ